MPHTSRYQKVCDVFTNKVIACTKDTPLIEAVKLMRVRQPAPPPRQPVAVPDSPLKYAARRLPKQDLPREMTDPYYGEVLGDCEQVALCSYLRGGCHLQGWRVVRCKDECFFVESVWWLGSQPSSQAVFEQSRHRLQRQQPPGT